MTVSSREMPLTKKMAWAAVASAATGVGFLLTAPIPLVPGAIHWRVLAFLPCLFGILFGPKIGFISGAIGNTIWAVLGGYFNIATPIFDLVGVGLTGLIPGLFAKPEDAQGLKGLARATIFATLSGVVMIPIVAVGFQWAGASPFWPAVYFLAISDMPPIVVGTPISLAIVAPVLKSAGLLEGRW